MRTLVSLLLLFSISLTFSQETIYKEYSSEILNDTRDLSIYLPKGYNKDSISNFPLAIVLDGHKLFDLYVGASNYYAQLDHAPEQIVDVPVIDVGATLGAFTVTNCEAQVVVLHVPAYLT